MEAPRPAVVGAPAVAPAVVAAAAVVGAAVAVVAAGCVEGAEAVGLLNAPPAGPAGCAADVVAGAAAVVAAVPGVVAGVDWAASPLKRPPAGAAASVEDGTVVDVDGSRDGWVAGVAEIAAAEVVEAGAPSEENIGFAAASPPAEGIGKRKDVCEVCAPLVAGVVAAPKSGLVTLLSAAVVGVVDSAGWAAPNNGFPAVAAPGPKRPPDAGCEVVGVAAAVEDGVLEAGAALKPPPKREDGLFPGGGPAGVVEVFPNKEPAAGPGVAALLPNKLAPD